MNYHNITKDDMLNGDGLRVVLWVSGCEHHCEGCHNQITWNPYDGLIFDKDAKQEIFKELEKDYVQGITFSGGDPLHPKNRDGVFKLMREIKLKFPKKTIWLYTGYTWEQIYDNEDLLLTIGSFVDVLVDGKFEKENADVNYHWAGSTNQRVIDVEKTLLNAGAIVLYEKEVI